MQVMTRNKRQTRPFTIDFPILSKFLSEENCVNTEMETDHNIATEWFYLFYNVNHISTIKC